MGKKPDEIEQDIRRQRNYISNRVEGLQHRVQEDMRSVRAEAGDRASEAMEGAKGRVQNARQSFNVDSLKSMVEEHTVSSMAGALGVGVLLGVVSESIGGSGGNGQKRPSPSQRAEMASSGETGGQSSNGGGGIGGMIASMVGPAANTAQEELQDLVREGFSLMKEQLQQVKEGKTDSSVGQSYQPSSEAEARPSEPERPRSAA